MMSPQMARIDEHLQRLRLTTVRERLEALLQEAASKEFSYADFLDRVLTEEVATKTAKRHDGRASRGPLRAGRARGATTIGQPFLPAPRRPPRLRAGPPVEMASTKGTPAAT